MQPLPAKKFWAFISYSSKDRKWGQWLHKRLENYTIPKEFQGMELSEGVTLGKHLRPVFRDRDELAGSSNLGPAILKAIQESRYLIVLCSPNSAKSDWVNKEIEDFKMLGGEKNILALILEGIPNASSVAGADPSLECFPPALRYPAEPLAGDLRKEGDGRQRGFLKVLSGISQLDFDSLYRRHERAQRSRRMFAAGLAAAVIVALSGLAWFAFEQKAQAVSQTEEAVKARNEARAELAGSLLFQGQAAIAGNAFRDALPPLLRAADLYAEMGKRPAELERLLRIAVEKNHLVADFRAHKEGVNFSQFSADGSSLLTSTLVYGELALWDTASWNPHFTKTLDSLRKVALSKDARSVITIQSDRGDVEGKPLATYWKRWNASDGSLIESKELKGVSFGDFLSEESKVAEIYSVFNAYDNSRSSDDPLKLEFREVETNRLVAGFSFPADTQVIDATYLPKQELLIFERENGSGLADRSSGIEGSRNLPGAVKYMEAWFVSDDGKRLFGQNRNDDGRWFVWDTGSGELLHEAEGKPKLGFDMEGLAYSNDDAFIATLDGFGFVIRKVDISYWRDVTAQKTRTSLADGLQAIGEYSSLEVRDIRADTSATFPMGTRENWRIDLHPATRRLVTFDNIGRAMVFELPEAELLPVPALDSQPVAFLKASDDRSQALFRTPDKDILVWDVEGERIISRLKGAADSELPNLEWLPKVNRLLTRESAGGNLLNAEPQTIRVFDTSNGDKLFELGDSFAWGISPDGGTLLALTRKGLQLLPIGREGNGIPLPDPRGEDDDVSSRTGFSDDSSLVAIAASNGKVTLHDARTGELRKEFDLGRPEGGAWQQHSFSAVLFHSGDSGLLIGSNLGTSFLIDIPTGQVQAKAGFRCQHDAYMTFQDEGRMLVTGSFDPVTFWTFPELAPISSFAGSCDRVTVFPKEGRFLSEYRYGETVFGNLGTGIEIHTFGNPIASSPAYGIVAVRRDSDIEILDFRTGNPIKTTPSEFTNGGFFSGDARFLYAVSSDDILLKLEIEAAFGEILSKARMEAPH